MKYTENTTEFYSDAPTAVTLGKFDGLHRGHQKLIREIVKLQEQGYRGVVFTIAPDHVPVLLMPEEKRQILESYGISYMIRCPFVPEILNMEPEQFIAEVLSGSLQAKHLIVGTDFRFGHDRTGDVSVLARFQEKYGYSLQVIEKERLGRRDISSTYVREALAKPDLELAGKLLGYDYFVEGVIQHGKQLGRRIGMPTINLIPDPYKLLPPQGVYFSRAAVDGKTYCGVTNIGYKPTVDGSFLGVETYLYGMNEEVYGKKASVSLLQFRRPEQKFSSVGRLKAQMESDIAAGKEYFHVE